MFKQHVDSVHLGITSSQVVSAGQQIILSPNNVISTTQSGQTLAVNPLTITPGGAATQVVQASQGQILHTASGQQMTLVTGVKSAAPGVVTLSPTPTQGQVTGQVTVTQPSLATSGVLTSIAGTSGGGQLATVATAGQVSVNNAVTTAVTTVVHKCPKCGFLAPSKNQLTQHRKKFHGCKLRCKCGTQCTGQCSRSGRRLRQEDLQLLYLRLHHNPEGRTVAALRQRPPQDQEPPVLLVSIRGIPEGNPQPTCQAPA